jgi:hypothetical protein
MRVAADLHDCGGHRKAESADKCTSMPQLDSNAGSSVINEVGNRTHHQAFDDRHRPTVVTITVPFAQCGSGPRTGDFVTNAKEVRGFRIMAVPICL